MGKLDHFIIGKRNLHCRDHWEELDSGYRITKPTVLCFGGNGTTTSLEANSMCKTAQGLVGIKGKTCETEMATQEDVDFIGIAYGNDSDIFRMGTLTDEERIELARDIFTPLFLDEQANPLSNEQIVKNFNLITFFAHCHGAVEVSNLLGEIYYNMFNSGISEKVIFDAINQTFAVTYAPMQKCACPSLQVIPMSDELLRIGPNGCAVANKIIEDKLRNKSMVKGNIAYKEDENTISVLSSKLTLIYMDEHTISTTKRDENWRLKETPRYGDEVSQVMGYALSSSVANSLQNQESDTFIPKPSIDNFLVDTKSILADTQNFEFEETLQRTVQELGISHNNENNEPTEDEQLNDNGTTTITTSTATIEVLKNIAIDLHDDIYPEQ